MEIFLELIKWVAAFVLAIAFVVLGINFGKLAKAIKEGKESDDYELKSLENKKSL